MKLIHRVTIILSLSSVFYISGRSQERATLSQDTIARIGLNVITARDLLERLELTPFPYKDKPSRVDSAKVRALLGLIAEKVLANEAKRRNFPEDQVSKLMHRELENLFIRDELFKREVEANAKPDAEEVIAGMNRFKWKLKVIAFLVRSEADGKALVKRLRGNKTKNILQDQLKGMFTEIDTINIHFAGPDSAYENAAYSIDHSKVSKPFYSHNLGWSVLYLLDKVTNPESAKMKKDERSRKVEKILKERHEQDIGERYSLDVLSSKNAVADSGVFNILADSIIALRREIDPKYYQRDGGYMVTSEMVDVLIDRLKPYMDTTFITINGGNMTLGELLEMFRYENFVSKSLEGFIFKMELNEEVKHLVGNELLAREGRRQFLQNSAPVQRDMELWTGYWAARQLYYDVRDSVKVTNEDVIEHLLKTKEIFGRYYEVNVREILTSTPEVATRIINELHLGKNLADMVPQYSIHAEWVKNGGESGYFLVLQHPEIGFRALLANTGTLVGPVKLDEGYSLFTVLGKRRTKEAIVGFDTLCQNIRKRLLNEKRKQATGHFIAKLAHEQQVRIDYKKLKLVKPTLIQMFAQRFMGFGGMMTAVPLLMQQWDWIKEFEQPVKAIP
jgi:parvulin-like peptidyl-prolyl isomerase